jgi:hypothetical protein
MYFSYLFIYIILAGILFFVIFSFIISLLSGAFILYNQVKKHNPKIKIEGNIKINLFWHIFYLVSIIICPVVLISKNTLFGFVVYYCLSIFLIIIVYKLVKKQMPNVEEIICFINIPAIIKLKQNKITYILRPYSNKIIRIILLSLLLILILAIIFSSIIKGA